MKLEIKNLKKHFGSHTIAIEIDRLTIPDCQTLAILGPSGSGKSTLLRLIAGLIYPDSGTIVLGDQEIVYKEKELRDYRKSIGVVFQSFNLFGHLTALENIVLPLQHVQGLSKEEAIKVSIDLLKRFELDKHADKKPYALSGGQSQRVALIRAIAIRPKLLLLDEPTSALDPFMTSEVLELILELKRENRDLIMVTHHFNFARRIADQIVFVFEGKVLDSGAAKDVFENPQSLEAKQYLDKVKLF